eukprot:scaffold9361_cov134-Skeletonema_marinoi.AAC.5
MQNLISNWTKINQDHFEYFEKDEASVAGGGGGSVHSVRSNLSHALNAAGIDPRSPETGMGPSPPPPSGSSLSNVSFSKGTITAPSRQPTPDTASSISFASRQTRGVMSSSHNGFTQQHLELYQQQQQQQQHQQLTQAMMMQHQQNGSRRRAHQSNHVHGGHNSSNHNHINPLPPPQAGADAILGRRKPAGIGQSSSHQHYNFDMASAMGLQQIHQGEPPSLSTSSEQQDTKRAAAAASGGLQRTQSSSLWHSQKSTQSNQSGGHSSRSSSNSVTASLDKMDAAAQAAMAELNSVNSSLNHGLANFSASNRSAQHQPNPITNISSNASAATNNSSRNILKFNRQKLRKSHSRSDLVREMALDRRHNNPSEQVHQFSESNPLQRRVSEKSSTSGTGSSNATPISSLNMSVGKSANFPTSLETSSNNSARQSTLRNGRSAEAPSFNSHTMMQDWNQSLTMRRQSQASAGVSSGGSTPVISNKNNLTGDRRVSNLSQGGNLDAINEQKPVDIGVVNIPSSQLQRQQQQQQQQQMDPGSGCDRCVQMESAILSLQADIEYVRTLELQKDIGGRLSRTVVFLRDASKRLADLSTRHKKEVKQSHYERAYWQNDMHLKLEKFAMMCKNLNEDAAQRSNEVKELTSKLEKVTSERNGLVSQVETLKARVGLYEGESVVQSRLRDNFEKGEAGALDLFDKAMKGRDETIEDLSNRLAAALEEVERSRISGNSMRRHIIFPSSRSMSHNSDPFGDAGSAPPSPKIRRSMCSEEEGEHDDSAKLSEKAKLSLEASMVQSSEREKALQSQLDVLEQELEQARAILQDTDDHYLEAQLSMKHTSSNSSL